LRKLPTLVVKGDDFTLLNSYGDHGAHLFLLNPGVTPAKIVSGKGSDYRTQCGGGGLAATAADLITDYATRNATDHCSKHAVVLTLHSDLLALLLLSSDKSRLNAYNIHILSKRCRGCEQTSQ